MFFQLLEQNGPDCHFALADMRPCLKENQLESETQKQNDFVLFRWWYRIAKPFLGYRVLFLLIVINFY